MDARTALVTGGARRLGRAICLGLARSGVNVVVHFHVSREAALDLVREIKALGVKAWTVQADLSRPDAAGHLVELVCRTAAPLDIVVNNAAQFATDSLADLTPESVARQTQINALSPFQIGRAFAALGRQGCIVNLLDSRIVHHDSAHVAYALSKRMLWTLTRIMALEFAPQVRVNAVAPGLILPPPGEDESFLRRMASRNPLKTCGSAEEIAKAVLFLVEARFVTGQVLFVDGGYHMKGRVYGC